MIELAVAGALGGLVKSLAEQKGKILLPGVEVKIDPVTNETSKYIHLGFISAVLLGSVVGVFLSTNPITAFTTGLSAQFIIEKIIEQKPDLITRTVS